MRGRFCRKQQVSCRTYYYKCTWDVQSHYLPQEFSHTNFRGLQSCHFIITARCYSQKHKKVQEEGWKDSALWEAWYSRKREEEKEQSGLEKNNLTNITSSTTTPNLHSSKFLQRTVGHLLFAQQDFPGTLISSF